MAYRNTLVRRGLPAVLDGVIAAFLTNLRQARVGRVRGIHESRVASRRLREFLRAAGPGPAADVRVVRRDIRRLAQALGRVREIDVSLELLATHPLTATWPRAVRARIQRECVAERDRRQAAMVRRLGKLDLVSLRRQLRELGRTFAATADASADGGIAARRRVRARTLRHALGRAGTVYAPATLHAVRIATKKLRYNLEWSRAASGPALAAELDELKSAQQLLGEIQDLHVLEGALRRIAAQAALDRTTVRSLEAGALRLEAAGRERHAQFVKQVPRLNGLARDLGRKTPLEWIRRRPARMTGARAKAEGTRARGRTSDAT